MTSTFADTRRARDGVIGLVPTMGFLHEGHLSLIAAARRECDAVVVSVFVNPLQFGEASDLEAYPRDLERDARLAADAGADVVFAPSHAVMYPEQPLTTVHVAEIGDGMEGLHRPGHFTGVATVVTKLFNGLRPDRAYFGRKDAQQLAVVSRLGADLSFPIRIEACPTIRESDGLALSSRNPRLSRDEREKARCLSRGLMTAADAVDAGERDGAVLEALVVAETTEDDDLVLEYATLATQATARPMAYLDEPAFLAAAMRVGTTRLIDNVHFDVGPDGLHVDRGRRLDAPSVLYEEA